MNDFAIHLSSGRTVYATGASWAVVRDWARAKYGSELVDVRAPAGGIGIVDPTEVPTPATYQSQREEERARITAHAQATIARVRQESFADAAMRSQIVADQEMGAALAALIEERGR
jgi:hypothetical protein